MRAEFVGVVRHARWVFDVQGHAILSFHRIYCRVVVVRWRDALWKDMVSDRRHLDVILHFTGETSFLRRRDPLGRRLRQLQQTL